MDAERTPIYRVGAPKNQGNLMDFYFEVDTIGHKTSRVVYNLEDALGWIGGLLGILHTVQFLLLKPIIKDALVYHIAKSTKSGKEVGIKSTKFYLKKILRNLMCLKCCKKFDFIFN